MDRGSYILQAVLHSRREIRSVVCPHSPPQPTSPIAASLHAGLPQTQYAEPRKTSARDHSQVPPLRLDATEATAGSCSRRWPSLRFKRFRQQQQQQQRGRQHLFSAETHDPPSLGRGECTAVPDSAGQHMHVQRLGRVLVGTDHRGGQQRFVNGSERDGRLPSLGAKIITRAQARDRGRGCPRHRAGDPTHGSSSAFPCTTDRYPLATAGPGLGYHPHARGMYMFPVLSCAAAVDGVGCACSLSYHHYSFIIRPDGCLLPEDCSQDEEFEEIGCERFLPPFAAYFAPFAMQVGPCPLLAHRPSRPEGNRFAFSMPRSSFD